MTSRNEKYIITADLLCKETGVLHCFIDEKYVITADLLCKETGVYFFDCLLTPENCRKIKNSTIDNVM